MKRIAEGDTRIFLACGATDFRKQIPGLVAAVSLSFKLDPYNGDCVFIFCNRKRDSIKVLRYDQNGFILATKKLLDDMKFQWPRTPDKVKEISFQQVEWLFQALLHARKKLFGPSTEATQMDGQLSLFESVQELAEQLNLSKEKINVKPYTRVSRKPGVRQKMLAGLPQEVEEYVIPADETCGVCGAKMKVTGKRIVRTEVEFSPAKLIVKQIVQQVAKCTECGEKGSPNVKSHFQKAAVPVPPLAHLISTPSLIAQVMYQKFAMGMPLDTKGKEIPGSKGAEGREYVNLLFKIEDEIKNLPYEEKKQKRQDASRPILDAFWSWVEKTSAMYTTNEKLTQALGYCQNQRKYLETYLEDGRLPVSNNYCEVNIKPFATARRAWLFADNPKGAFANGVLYTLVESARANELDVYEYLKYLLTEMPNNHHLEDPSVIDSLLPWSKELPEQCHLKRNRKKCLKH